MNLNGIDKVCVLGSTGFVGSSITNLLDDLSIEWKGISRKHNSHPNLVTIELDKTQDQRKLVEIINEHPVVINALGSFKPNNFESDTRFTLQQFWDNNEKLAQIISQSKVRKFLQISSGGTVYGETRGTPAYEDQVLTPISWYGRAKVMEELLMAKTVTAMGASYVCARVTNPFGNAQYSKHGFIDVLLNCIAHGTRFNTFANPLYKRDFIHCKDMARSIVHLLCDDITSGSGVYVFNVGSGISTSLHEIVELVQQLKTGTDIKLDREITDFDVVQSTVDISRLRKTGIDTLQFTYAKDYIKEKLIGNS